ncbi:hypothetical protein O4J55_03010 [Paracoccus sp. PXZ]
MERDLRLAPRGASQDPMPENSDDDDGMSRRLPDTDFFTATNGGIIRHSCLLDENLAAPRLRDSFMERGIAG